MKKNEILALGTGIADIPVLEQIERMAAAGWNGVFTAWHDGEELPAKRIRDLGLHYQSVHAEFYHIDRLWENDASGDEEAEVHIRCLRDSAQAGVDLVVMHTIIGMDKHTPTQIGVDRFGRIFDKAKEYGVRVALENTEGLVYLDTLMQAYGEEKHVGFCIDTGHEQCYNGGADLLAKYGNRLFCTHLNDNMGQTGEEITWLDDAHMLPFDGIIDWKHTAKRLQSVGFDGELSFELIKDDRPNRTTTAIYAPLTIDEYVALALQRAKKFAALMRE